MSKALFAATATDCYKPGHGPLYPTGTVRKYGNFTPRSAKRFIESASCAADYDNKVVNYGLYGALQELKELWDKFFAMPEDVAIRKYARRMDNMCQPGFIVSEPLRALHRLGYLPITILAIEEGERVNVGVPLYVIYNSLDDDSHAWLVNYLETIMSSYVWKMICNATIAYEYRRVLEEFADLTCDDRSAVMFQAHDFSFRGMSGPEDAMRSGSAHLTSFAGTDTIPALDYAEEYYGADSDNELLAASVTATEHAVATANILYRLQHKIDALAGTELSKTAIHELRLEAEREYILEIITQKVPKGFISLVCDSFDFWNVIGKVMPSIRTEIESRIKDALGNARVVVRPDSGDPVKVITGYVIYPNEFDNVDAFLDHCIAYGSIEFMGYEVVQIGNEYRELNHTKLNWSEFLGKVIPDIEVKGAIEVLWENFGGTMNSRGYKVLNPYVGLIYGDSITVARTEAIMTRLMRKGFASSNVVLGVGSYTYQYVTRDTFGMAVKATGVQIGDEFIELYKDPATDSSKRSHKGFLRVVKDEHGNFRTDQQVAMTWEDLETGSGELKPLFKNGEFLRKPKLSDIRSKLGWM